MPLTPDGPELQKMYSARFGARDDYRIQVWKVLTPFFCKWYPETGTILDLGAGYCELINNAHAKIRYAMDLNPDVRKRAAEGIAVLEQNGSELWPLPDGHLDAVFTSNFLEHLPDKRAIKTVLSHAYRCLRPGGRIIAMGPNIKYLPGAYWDFFDHYVELTDLSLSEALSSCHFEVEKRIDRFLPYTMSQEKQYPIWMLRFYLAMPLIWPVFGKQFLVIGKKPLEGPAGINGH